MRKSTTPVKLIFLTTVIAVFSGSHTAALAKTCLYVSSYHKGYEWSDGIERGIDTVLQGKCNVDKFYMDTKRNKDKAFGAKMGQMAKEYITQTKPDIVIACDDNASRHLVKPYFKDADTPFVFCGVNHNVDAYSYPYSNVTGMIEIAPVKPMMKVVQKTVGDLTSGVYLSVDVHSQHKEYNLNKKIYAEAGIELDRILVTSMDGWVEGYKKAQEQGEFVIIGSNGGLKDWDNARARQVALEHSKVFTVTNMDWMIDYAMLAMTKVAEEQGEWAAELALEILSGTKPSDIPIVANRKWDIYINTGLLDAGNVSLPKHIVRKAVKFEG